MDRISSETRSKNMSRIRSRGNRTTEARLRAILIRSGINGWKVHGKLLTGTPDFYFPSLKLAVFVDGCFWHGCPQCGHIPKSNIEYWQTKIKRNQRRDKIVAKQLKSEGWLILRLWEHEVRDNTRAVIQKIRTRINRLQSK